MSRAAHPRAAHARADFPGAGGIADEIAAQAARLVLDEGLDYGAAKRRALRDLDLPARTELPGNDLVEDEIRARIALFHADTQPAELAALRRVAEAWMERLAPFRPHLAGAVWRGTANRLSAVHLDLYADDPKSAELALVDQRIDYDVHTRTDARGRDHDALVLDVPSRELGERITLVLHVLDHDDLRGALKPDARGQTQRGDLSALRARMAAERAEVADAAEADAAREPGNPAS